MGLGLKSWAGGGNEPSLGHVASEMPMGHQSGDVQQNHRSETGQKLGGRCRSGSYESMGWGVIRPGVFEMAQGGRLGKRRRPTEEPQR